MPEIGSEFEGLPKIQVSNTPPPLFKLKLVYGPGGMGGYSLYSDDRDDRHIFRGCNR